MKIWQSMIGLVLLLAMTMTTGFAATLEKETIKLMDSVSKVSADYKICNTLVNGKELETDVPGYILSQGGKDTVYVPVSTIYRSLGASVSWSEKLKKLTVIYNKNTYVFTVNSANVTVNNKTVTIDDNMPVRLMKFSGTDRTMLPVSFLAKTMGMEMTYQPEIRTVNISQPMAKVLGLNYNGTGQYKEVRIPVSAEISTTSYTIDGSSYGGKSKIIVEFQNAIMAPGIMQTLQVGDGQIARIDLVNPGKTPPRVRLEMETNKLSGFHSYYDKATKEQVVQVVNTLKDIAYTQKGDYHVVAIKTGVEPELAIKKLQGKLVIDFLNTKLVYNNGSASEKSILSAGVIGVAYSQFDPSTEYKAGDLVARTVVNFSDYRGQDIAFVKKTAEGVEIFIEGDPDKGIQYNKETSATSKLELAITSGALLEKHLDEQTRVLSIRIPKNAIVLDSVYRDYKDNILEYLDVNVNDPERYLLTMKLSEGTVAYDNSREGVFSMSFINEQIKNSSNGKKLIVLDAGHGGSDPGTIGKFTGVKEKDLALKAVFALQNELERNGYDVILTRSTDTRVELYQRTDLANEVNADLFISIHYNAADSLTAKGVEVLYYPDAAGVKYAFAKTIYERLIADTGATQRGVIKRPLLVVTRETKMPSALVEMGFVSNADEEKLVQQEAYLEAQVKAIAEAVQIYLANH